MIGKVLFEYDSLTSTNQWALEIASQNGVEEGAVVQAHHQSEGRGQMGTRWLSDAGQNLMFSVILRPYFLPLDAQFYLNKAMSLAVVDALEHFLHQPIRIKWPNDIYVDHEKMCGILIQNTIQKHQISLSIVGIGLNVNQIHFSRQLPNPTSMQRKMSQSQDLNLVRSQLFKTLDKHYQHLKDDSAYADEDYRNRLYRRGEDNWFETADGSSFRGKILDVTKSGALIIEDAQGELQAFTLKEISYR